MENEESTEVDELENQIEANSLQIPESIEDSNSEEHLQLLAANFETKCGVCGDRASQYVI